MLFGPHDNHETTEYTESDHSDCDYNTRLY